MHKHPVIIVGGGPVGLISSIMLSQINIPHILFERHPDTSIHPKACGLNLRTIEIFRQIGIEDEILKHRAPPESQVRTAWYTSLGPNGKEIITREAWGGGQYKDEYEAVSPCTYSTLPQIRLEPILKKRAIDLNPGGIFYNTEVTDVKEESDKVVVTVLDRASSEVKKFVAIYVIGADGGRALTDQLGIPWEGERNIVDMVSAHIKAPISLHHPDPSVFISWFISPTLGGSIGTGYLYHLGPYPSTPDTEEWVFAFALNPKDPKKFDEQKVLDRMKSTLQIPDLKVKVESLSHWYVNAITAARYRSRDGTGRVLLVGDACHRIPPWGALGLNSGIQDAHNLVWKLGIALKDENKSEDYNSLLDTYGEERRPIGQRVARTSLHNLRSHGAVMDVALGLSPSNTEEQNISSMNKFFDKESPEGAKIRAAVVEAQRILDGEFHAIGAEMGWFYPNVDVNGEGQATRHDGQLNEKGELDCLYYHPSTIPGHHLPHAWLRTYDEKSRKTSTRDLVDPKGFLFITQDESGFWEKVIQGSGMANLIKGAVIGKQGMPRKELVSNSMYEDLEGTWAQLCGVTNTGAVLVRPDGIVAWRTQTSSGVTPEKIQHVISTTLKIPS